MKNLLVYISPDKKFDKERELLAMVQIDNSLELGWKPKDFLLVTNFHYEYMGVKSVLVGDNNFCAVRPRSIKTSILPRLIDLGIIEPGQLYWNHDFDAYQMNYISESELGIDGIDFGLTDYGWKERWCMGSYFFRSTGKDILEVARDIIFTNIEDEAAFRKVARLVPSFNVRHKRLNITYNFGMRHVDHNWKIAEHPIKVVHFHPWYPLVPTLDIFMYGKNPLGHPIIDERFTKLLQKHGIK